MLFSTILHPYLSKLAREILWKSPRVVGWMGKFHLCCWTFLQLLLVHFTTSQSLASCLPVLASTAWFLGSASSPNLCHHSLFSHSIFYVLQLHNTQPSVTSTLFPMPYGGQKGLTRSCSGLAWLPPKREGPIRTLNSVRPQLTEKSFRSGYSPELDFMSRMGALVSCCSTHRMGYLY